MTKRTPPSIVFSSGDRMQDDHNLFTHRVAKVGFAAIAAFGLGFIGHYQLGFSRPAIRIGCLVIASLTALIVETRSPAQDGGDVNDDNALVTVVLLSAIGLLVSVCLAMCSPDLGLGISAGFY